VGLCPLWTCRRGCRCGKNLGSVSPRECAFRRTGPISFDQVILGVRLFHRSWGDGLRSDAEFLFGLQGPVPRFLRQSFGLGDCLSHTRRAADLWPIVGARQSGPKPYRTQNLRNREAFREIRQAPFAIMKARSACSEYSPGGQFGELWWVQAGHADNNDKIYPVQPNLTNAIFIICEPAPRRRRSELLRVGERNEQTTPANYQ
jgi:hypothetical protein